MKRAGLVLLTIAIGMSAARAARAEDDTSSTRPAASSEAAPSKKNEKLSAFATQRPHAQGGERNLETGKVYKKGQFLPLNKPVQLALPLSNGRTKGSVDPVTSATRGPVSIPVRSSDTGPVSIPVRTATPPAEAAPSASAPALAPAPPEPVPVAPAPPPVPPPGAAEADDPRARYEAAARLEARDPASALATYRALAGGHGPWAGNALFAAGRLAADRGQRAEAQELLRRYLDRFPSGPNVADARALLDRLR